MIKYTVIYIIAILNQRNSDLTSHLSDACEIVKSIACFYAMSIIAIYMVRGVLQQCYSVCITIVCYIICIIMQNHS